MSFNNAKKQLLTRSIPNAFIKEYKILITLLALPFYVIFVSPLLATEISTPIATSPIFFNFLTSFGTSGLGPNQFRNPKAMAFSRDGTRLAVCDTDNHRVIVLRVHLVATSSLTFAPSSRSITSLSLSSASTVTAAPNPPTGSPSDAALPTTTSSLLSSSSEHSLSQISNSLRSDSESSEPHAHFTIQASPSSPAASHNFSNSSLSASAKKRAELDDFFSPDLDEVFGPSDTASTFTVEASNDNQVATQATISPEHAEFASNNSSLPPVQTIDISTPLSNKPLEIATEASFPQTPNASVASNVDTAAVDKPILGIPSFTVEVILGGPWPYEGSLEPADWPDRYRELDHADGLLPPRTYSGRPYLGGQGRIRPWYNVPIDRFHYPQGVAWLDDETLLVSDTENHRIKAVRLSGEVLFILGQEGWKDGYFHQPLGVAVDNDGSIYVVEPRSKYIRGLGLDFGQRQRVQGNRLQIFGPDKKFFKRLGHMHHMSGRRNTQFKDLTRVCVSKDRIFLADNGNHRVIVLDKNLNHIETLNKWPFYHLRYPNGVQESGDGRIAIADTGNDTVLIISPPPKRRILQIIGGFGTEPGRFSKPWEAHFGPGGDLYVLDTMNCRIQVFRGPFSNEYPHR